MILGETINNTINLMRLSNKDCEKLAKPLLAPEVVLLKNLASEEERASLKKL